MHKENEVVAVKRFSEANIWFQSLLLYNKNSDFIMAVPFVDNIHW